ncbi:MAG: hypothetical protein V4510_09620 [bacterium]
MSDAKPGDDWKANDAGVLVPPGEAAKPVIQRAEFAVKVAGFAPEPIYHWDAIAYTERTSAYLPLSERPCTRRESADVTDSGKDSTVGHAPRRPR